MRCLNCETEINKRYDHGRLVKFCNRQCWRKGTNKTPNRGRFKPGIHNNVGSQNPHWLGTRASYRAVHKWVQHRLGTPKICDNCGTKKAKRYEWANLSGKSLRDLGDWARLCKSCHSLIDGTGRKSYGV